MPAVRLLRLSEVMRLVGLRRSVIYQRVRHDTFPKPRKVGRATVWREDELTRWINALPLVGSNAVKNPPPGSGSGGASAALQRTSRRARRGAVQEATRES
jgi:prophage regulatory protein